MLRLLFCSAALLPIAILPFFTTEADALDVDASTEAVSYAEAVRAPSIASLADCEAEDLPVFFHDEYVTTHSAEFIRDGLQAAEGCGAMEIVVIPVLPDFAEAEDRAQSEERAVELREMVRDSGYAVSISDEPVQEDGSALYLNGRAAILQIQPSEIDD